MGRDGASRLHVAGLLLGTGCPRAVRPRQPFSGLRTKLMLPGCCAAPPKAPAVTATLASIFLAKRRSLIGSIRRIVRDPHDAEDVAQETYLRVRKAIEAGPVEHVEAFLFQTARNLARNHQRHTALRDRVERADLPEAALETTAAPQPTPEAGLLHRQRLECLQATIARLPPRAREAWLLSRVEKWPYPKIAEHLGVSPGTVFNDLKMAHGLCVAALARIDRE